MSALRLDLSIPQDWSRIDPAREAVGLLVWVRTQDGGLRDALAMVSEELLENALKYGKPETAVTLSLHDDAAGVVIAVSNQLVNAAHGLVLRERVEWVSSFANASDAYSAAITRVYEREERAADEAGLGIVRIAYEGGCGLEVDLSEPGRVTVRAACSVSARVG